MGHSQECPINTGGLQSSIHNPTLFLLDKNDVPENVTRDIAIFVEDTTLCIKFERASSFTFVL